MQPKQNVIDCYNKTAANYALKFINELADKHLDRILLQAFVKENKDKGKLIDLGCGPGQTTAFLHQCGITDMVGTDISPAMIDTAKNINPQLNFETADMLALSYADDSFGSAIAFYAIVHFDYDQLTIAFKEIKRILKKDGQFLFCFHIGDNVVHLDQLHGEDVNIDFHFLDTAKVIAILKQLDLEIIDVIERQAYDAVEYASKRAYIWVKRKGPRTADHKR